MEIISRQQWGAQHGRGGIGLQRRGEVVIHTAAGAIVPADWSLADAMQAVRNIERFHAVTRGWDGIGYSFLVDPLRGWAFEGRGWGRNGAHTQKGRNNTAYAICFLGHGDRQGVTAAGWEGAAEVIRDGLAHGKLTDDYVVTGHRNYTNKSCPGDLIYPYIGRLRGLTATPPDPPTPKDWLDMDEQRLREIFREELTAGDHLVSDGARQYLVREVARKAIHIKTGEDFDRLRSAFPHRGNVDERTLRSTYEVVL